MADVKIIDIDSEQWNIKDQNARDRLTILEEKLCSIGSIQLGGTFNIQAKKNYMGEDNTYQYFRVFSEPTVFTWDNPSDTIEVIPIDTNNLKLLHLSLFILQFGNSQVIQMTQVEIGTDSAGILTYLSNINPIQKTFKIGIDGIVRVKK